MNLIYDKVMSRQIYNGGIRGAILNLVDDSDLSPEDLERKKYLNSLPKNQWIDLDENGRMISKEVAENNWKKEIEKYKPIKK